MSSLIPPRMFGITSELAMIWVVSGSTLSAILITTVPRSYGPATAGVTTTIERGAPLYGPARYALPETSIGFVPLPAAVIVVPISLAGEQLDAALSAVPDLAAAAAIAASGQ